MALSKQRISSPLEAGQSILDTHSLPAELTEALDYTSRKLQKKALHITLVVVRKPYQLPSSVPPSPTSASAEPSPRFASPVTTSLRQLVRRGTTAAAAKSKSHGSISTPPSSSALTSPTFTPGLPTRSATAPDGISLLGSPRRFWPPTPGSPPTFSPMMPGTPMTPGSIFTTLTTSSSASPAPSPLFSPFPLPTPPLSSCDNNQMSYENNPNISGSGAGEEGAKTAAFGIRLVYTTPLSTKTERMLRDALHKAARRMGLNPAETSWCWPAPASTCGLIPKTTSTTTTTTTTRESVGGADLIRGSLLQNETLYSAEGLALLGLDRLYTFKAALAAYSRALKTQQQQQPAGAAVVMTMMRSAAGPVKSPETRMLEDAVDELRRLVLAHNKNGNKSVRGGTPVISRTDLHRSYDFIGAVSSRALADVETMYSRAYGGEPLGSSSSVITTNTTTTAAAASRPSATPSHTPAPSFSSVSTAATTTATSLTAVSPTTDTHKGDPAELERSGTTTTRGKLFMTLPSMRRYRDRREVDERMPPSPGESTHKTVDEEDEEEEREANKKAVDEQKTLFQRRATPQPKQQQWPRTFPKATGFQMDDGEEQRPRQQQPQQKQYQPVFKLSTPPPPRFSPPITLKLNTNVAGSINRAAASSGSSNNNNNKSRGPTPVTVGAALSTSVARSPLSANTAIAETPQTAINMSSPKEAAAVALAAVGPAKVVKPKASRPALNVETTTREDRGVEEAGLVFPWSTDQKKQEGGKDREQQHLIATMTTAQSGEPEEEEDGEDTWLPIHIDDGTTTGATAVTTGPKGDSTAQQQQKQQSPESPKQQRTISFLPTSRHRIQQQHHRGESNNSFSIDEIMRFDDDNNNNSVATAAAAAATTTLRPIARASWRRPQPHGRNSSGLEEQQQQQQQHGQGRPESSDQQHVGPMTPNGYDDISPITRGEWGFLFSGETWTKAKTAAVETC